MKRSLIPVALVVFGALALPAFARDGYHHHGGHGGSRVSIGLGFYGPAYYGPAYYPAYPSYYEREIVYARPVYARPVYQGRAVVVDGTLETDVQLALKRRGFYSGPVDGDIGPGTRAAIRAYQSEHGLVPSGRIDTLLLRSLKLD